MSEQQSDRRIEQLKERLQDDLVDPEGRRADPDAVAEAIDRAAEPFVDAPVQEFAPLLIEHDARDALRDEQGLHRELDDDESGSAPRPGETAMSGGVDSADDDDAAAYLDDVRSEDVAVD